MIPTLHDMSQIRPFMKNCISLINEPLYKKLFLAIFVPYKYNNWNLKFENHTFLVNIVDAL